MQGHVNFIRQEGFFLQHKKDWTVSRLESEKKIASQLFSSVTRETFLPPKEDVDNVQILVPTEKTSDGKIEGRKKRKKKEKKVSWRQRDEVGMGEEDRTGEVLRENMKKSHGYKKEREWVKTVGMNWNDSSNNKIPIFRPQTCEPRKEERQEKGMEQFKPYGNRLLNGEKDARGMTQTT